ncbi:Uma2 family endonuclease [Methylobacterium sp. A49B]|uniref:Uma2 family endonuclease n=1 Tax=Methylobacterium mesophilicum SR1.6/6 TaxID=908290 RepID=A0A6B9FPB3_9HYPH|nr:Uma2 family endonuclease [Methylobacterium mesophilicum]QGY04420.1 Uma2 family endonuclease [Methylobacterium mesophilicum SR1.6/6]
MALAVRRDARKGVAEYKRWLEPRPDEERWAPLDGEPVLMAPPRERHQAIVADLIRRNDDLTDGKGCSAMPGLAILSDAMDDVAPIPEVVVQVGPPVPNGCAADLLRVAEVLSPTTMSLDCGRKIDFYRTVPSLSTFPIVCSDEARIAVWRRAGEDWSVAAVGLDGTVPPPDLDGAVPVRDIDRGLAF